MKNTTGNKIFGLSLVILSTLGLLFSLSGITAIWVIRPRIRDNGSELLISLRYALATSQEGFTIMDEAIEDLLGDFSIIEETFENLDTTLEGVSGSLTTSGDLIGDDLKQTLLDTQTALSTAAISAELIDNTLVFLSRVPLLGVDYAPEVPLHISLEQAADNLNEFPDTFEALESDITTTNDGLGALQTNLIELSEQIQDFDENLEDAQTILLNFNDSIDVMINRLDSLNENLPTYLTILSLFVSGILFWLGLSQVNILRQGIVYLKGETVVMNLSDMKKSNRSQEKINNPKEIQ